VVPLEDLMGLEDGCGKTLRDVWPGKVNTVDEIFLPLKRERARVIIFRCKKKKGGKDGLAKRKKTRMLR
jgi:hypothetical protein